MYMYLQFVNGCCHVESSGVTCKGKGKSEPNMCRQAERCSYVQDSTLQATLGTMAPPYAGILDTKKTKKTK